MYGGNGFMAYPTFPMQYPTHGEGLAPMGLIPVELDIEGLYEDHDRRRRKNGSEKVVASHVHSVRILIQLLSYKQLTISSAAEPRTEHHNAHSEIEKRST
jgi:hypothetical protein